MSLWTEILKPPVDPAFLGAKIHALKSRIIAGPAMARLTTLPSPTALYKEILGGENELTPVESQRALIDRLVAHLLHLLTFTGGAPYALFEWQIRRFHLENLKVVLRAWGRKLDLPEFKHDLTAMPAKYALPVEKMLDARDLAAFAALVPLRDFADALASASPRYSQEARIFYVESALEKAYYDKAITLARAIDGDDREPCIRIVKTEILCYNILLVLRCARVYELSKEAVAGLVVQRGIFSDKPYVDALSSATLDRLFEMIPNMQGLNPSGRAVATMTDLEDALSRHLYRVVVSQFAASILDFGAVVAYYYLKQFELRDIMRLGEALRLEVPASEATKRLITAGT